MFLFFSYILTPSQNDAGPEFLQPDESDYGTIRTILGAADMISSILSGKLRQMKTNIIKRPFLHYKTPAVPQIISYPGHDGGFVFWLFTF